MVGLALVQNNCINLLAELLRVGLPTNGLKLEIIARLRAAVVGGAVLLAVRAGGGGIAAGAAGLGASV